MKRVGEKVLFKTDRIILKDIDLEFDDGKKRTYQIVEKKDTALIVPITSDGNVLLVREYFVAINDHQLALPKGRIEEGEQALEAANRELQEEVGYKAGRLDKIATLTMSPGYLSQRTHVFLARDLVKSTLKNEEDENIQVVPHPLNAIEQLIDEEKLTEARVIAALFLTRRYLESKEQ